MLLNDFKKFYNYYKKNVYIEKTLYVKKNIKIKQKYKCKIIHYLFNNSIFKLKLKKLTFLIISVLKKKNKKTIINYKIIKNNFNNVLNYVLSKKNYKSIQLFKQFVLCKNSNNLSSLNSDVKILNSFFNEVKPIKIYNHYDFIPTKIIFKKLNKNFIKKFNVISYFPFNLFEYKLIRIIIYSLKFAFNSIKFTGIFETKRNLYVK